MRINGSLQLSQKQDIWLFTIAVAIIAAGCSVACVGLMYLIAGPEAFHVRNAFIMAAAVPLLISTPISYVVGYMSYNLHAAKEELQQLAETDALTQLPNRRSFFDLAAHVLDGHEQNLTPAALLVIDADHFKELNDSYGHAVGDQALVIIADILKDNFRHSDLTCRVGGEEFAVLLPGMSMDDAQTVANRVVEHVAQSPISEGAAIIEFSVSCGIADTSVSYDLATLFKAADDAMYMAKKQGRNRAVTRPAEAA